jgi:hypothetical protein
VVLRDSDVIPVTHARQIVLNTPYVEERVNVVELVSCFSLLILQRVSYPVLVHLESPLGIESGTQTDKTKQKQKQKAAYQSQNIAPLQKQTLLAHTINPQSDSLPRKKRKDAHEIRIFQKSSKLHSTHQTLNPKPRFTSKPHYTHQTLNLILPVETPS